MTDSDKRIQRLENQVAALKHQLIQANQKLMNAYITINRIFPGSCQMSDINAIDISIKALESLSTKYETKG